MNISYYCCTDKTVQIKLLTIVGFTLKIDELITLLRKELF